MTQQTKQLYRKTKFKSPDDSRLTKKVPSEQLIQLNTEYQYDDNK